MATRLVPPGDRNKTITSMLDASTQSRHGRRAMMSVSEPQVASLAAVNVVAVLLGLSAATVGVVSVLPGGIRWAHLLTALALPIAVIDAHSRGRIGAYRVYSIGPMLLLFVAICLLAEFRNAEVLNLSIDLVTVIAPLIPFLGYISARLIVESAVSLMAFLRGIIAPSFLTVVIGLFQVMGIGGIDRIVLSIAPSAAAEATIISGGLPRATSLIGHWTGFGAYLTVILAATCVLAILERHSGQKRPSGFVFVALGSSTVGLLTTLTFSTVIVAAIVLLVSWRPAGFGLRLLAWAIPPVAIAVAMLGANVTMRFDQQFTAYVRPDSWIPDWLPDTIQYRLRIWTEETIPSIAERPATGWGSNLYGATQPGRTYPQLLDWWSSESQWLGLAITYGIPASLAFGAVLLALFATLRIARNNLRSSTTLVHATLPLTTLLLITVVASTTVPIFTNRGFPAAFWPVAGAIIAFASVRERSLGMGKAPSA